MRQKGQLVLRLESSAVQPAIISSSYTRPSQERHWEQLDISTWPDIVLAVSKHFVCTLI